MFLIVTVGFLLVFFTSLILLRNVHLFVRAQLFSMQGQHVLITGGSSGIGLAMAKLVYYQGANVTIVARDQKKLNSAKESVLSCKKSGESEQFVNTLSLDVTKNFDYIQSVLQSVAIDCPVTVLINCAGFAVASRFVDTPIEKFEQMMKLNYYASLYVTKALLPGMLEYQSLHPESGSRVMFVSSVAGQIGVYGYTGYSASKFALRGFAETLLSEVKHLGIGVILAFPPDTDTPGYQIENEGKPEETRLISGACSLQSPEQVASILIRDLKAGRFFSSCGFDGWMVTTLTYGLAPLESLAEGLLQSICLPLFKIVAIGYSWWMQSVVVKCSGKTKKRE